MAPVTIPVFICGLLTCILVEKFRWFGYGARLPEPVRHIMESYERDEDAQRTPQDKAKLIVQALIATWLITGLALHLAAVGLIGLTVIVLATAFTGVTEEHALGKAFQEALPFTALLTVFFSVVAVIIDQQLFKPVIQWVLAAKPEDQLALFYLANGLLSMVSDNVFVGTVYINEVKTALINGAISREHFDLLAVAINTGTNLPSVATPMARPHSCSCSPRPSLPCCASLMAAWSGWRCPIPWCWGLSAFSPWNCSSVLQPNGSIRQDGCWIMGHCHCPPRPHTDHERGCSALSFQMGLCSNSATIFLRDQSDDRVSSPHCQSSSGLGIAGSLRFRAGTLRPLLPARVGFAPLRDVHL